MKRKLLIGVTLSLLSITTFAQISTKQQPRSFKIDNVRINSANAMVLSSPDVNSLLIKEEKEANLFKPRACAALIPVNESFFDRAEKISLADADLYILKIKSEGALALNLYSDDFYIPENCELYLWNTDRSKCLGAFTKDNNSPDGRFATDYVYNDEMIIEYYQPKSVKESAKLNIEKIGYFYRDVINFEQESLLREEDNESEINLPYKGYQDAGSCNVNVNCSEGDNFRDVQRSVVRMLIPVSYYESAWCSGTLINNTDNDRKPYILSAAHCIEDITNSYYYSQILFYFNYEYSGCSNVSKEPSYSTLTGCTKLAHGNKFGEGDSDYLLLQLTDNIPQSFNAYWAGWTVRDELFSGCVGIHHPTGDVKKISTVDGKTRDMGYSEGYWDYDTHIMVKWKKTTNGYGITEGGSSGSALFNSKGQIIGTLSGGESSCYASNSYKVDWYGRFDVSFTKLKQWLDPKGYNYTDFGGREYTVGIDDVAKENIEISVYPVPATDKVSVTFDNLTDKAVLSVLDKLGRSVYSLEIPQGTSQMDIDIKGFAKGTYFVRLYSKGNSVVKKIIVQ
ncbi:MAG: T9SS type A sorting domain-containing protein [Bacteroidales bacterium]|nr:T9SS type A sorting domain-containing protein [Bacteroidales bacterium]